MIGTWRRAFADEASHYVLEHWDSYFMAPCKRFLTYVGSARDDGAPKCEGCLKALEEASNE